MASVHPALGRFSDKMQEWIDKQGKQWGEIPYLVEQLEARLDTLTGLIILRGSGDCCQKSTAELSKRVMAECVGLAGVAMLIFDNTLLPQVNETD